MQHSILSASGSSRWLNCPGSVKATKDIKSTSSIFAQEGTCAHELSAMILEDNINPHDYLGKTLTDAPDFVVNIEMINYAIEYANYVNAIPGDKYIETKVDYSSWAESGFGTSDAIVVDSNAKLIHVIDLKYGKGIEVSPENNTQGMLYALGAVSNMYFDYDITNAWTVVIHIYQPRIGNIEEWELPLKSLLTWADNIVKPAAALCMTDDAPRIPGPSQCTWCGYKAQCNELQEHVQKTISSDFDNLELPVIETGIDYQNIMANKKLIEGWLKAIEGYIFENLEHGTNMPGFKLVEGKSSRKWFDADATETYLKNKRYKVGEIYTQKLITPPQAEKLVGKETYAQFVKHGLVIKTKAKPALTTVNDKRPGLSLNIADNFDAL